MRFRFLFPYLTALVCTSLICSCRRDEPPDAPTGQVIRVRLDGAIDRLPIVAKEKFQIRSTDGAAIIAAGTWTVTLDGSTWRIGDQRLSGGTIELLQSSDGSVKISGRRYRGHFRLVAAADGKFAVLNDVDSESYLRGVLEEELLRGWDEETFRAQAIVARTYAMYEVRMSRADAQFHVADDTGAQVYGGMDAESSRANDAVRYTRGVVLVHGERGQERIFKSYFSSCCGGVTLSNYDAFNEAFHPALIEQSVGDLCSPSPRFIWKATLSKSELTRRVRTFGQRRNRPEKDIGDVVRVDIEATNQFGRPTRYLLTDSSGRRYSLGPEEARWAFNADRGDGAVLSSSFFTPVNEATSIRFEGRGMGHGVGMCQWCAEVRARSGLRHEDILLQAFPGARLIRAY
jgi:stage II sporulation protein D